MKKLGKHTVFFDFDNTISRFDVLDDMLARFSKGKEWQALEDRWLKGEIGSRECLQGQVETINIKRRDLDRYISTIKIDPYFKKLVRYLKKRRLNVVILSDNFDYILNRVLKNNRILGLPVYCNSLSFESDWFRPSFPLTDSKCGSCAHCKKGSLLKIIEGGAVSFYIGDGRSDICVSKEADIVFAKSYLKKYFEDNKLPHVPFGGLKDVYKYFKRSLI